MRRTGVLLAVLSLAGIITVTSPTLAEELGSILERVKELTTAGNFSKALQELSWAQKEIEKQHYEKLKGFFPETLADMKGGEAQAAGGMGFSSVDRTYTSADGVKTLKVALSGGTGGPLPGLGNLAALGQMAAAMGAQQPGVETVRIDGKTATLEAKKDEKRATLTVFLEAGSILTFEMDGAADSELLKKAANELKIADLEKYLKGA